MAELLVPVQAWSSTSKKKWNLLGPAKLASSQNASHVFLYTYCVEENNLLHWYVKVLAVRCQLKFGCRHLDPKLHCSWNANVYHRAETREKGSPVRETFSSGCGHEAAESVALQACSHWQWGQTRHLWYSLASPNMHFWGKKQRLARQSALLRSVTVSVIGLQHGVTLCATEAFAKPDNAFKYILDVLATQVYIVIQTCVFLSVFTHCRWASQESQCWTCSSDQSQCALPWWTVYWSWQLHCKWGSDVCTLLFYHCKLLIVRPSCQITWKGCMCCCLQSCIQTAAQIETSS